MRPFATSSQAPYRPQFSGSKPSFLPIFHYFIAPGNSGTQPRRSPSPITNDISKIKSDPFEGIDLSSASIEYN